MQASLLSSQISGTFGFQSFLLPFCQSSFFVLVAHPFCLSPALFWSCSIPNKFGVGHQVLSLWQCETNNYKQLLTFSHFVVLPDHHLNPFILWSMVWLYWNRLWSPLVPDLFESVSICIFWVIWVFSPCLSESSIHSTFIIYTHQWLTKSSSSP